MVYTACKSLAKWSELFLWTSHFDLEGVQKYPPVGICGGRIPPGITNIFKKSHLCQFLMYSKYLSFVDRQWRIQFCKNSSHLEFPRKHAAILDFVCFWIFLTKLSSPFGCITAQSMLYSDADETVNEIAQFTDYITFIAYKTCFLA